MLDYIRSNAQSFGVKVAFAIIILVFMFWGVGSLTDGGSSNVVAKVNGEPITAQQFLRSGIWPMVGSPVVEAPNVPVQA